MYQRTIWHDYPDISTLINAERLNNMESGIFEAARVSEDLSKALVGLYPQRIVHEVNAHVQGTETGTLQYYDIPKSEFDPERDGLLVWLKITNEPWILLKGNSQGASQGETGVQVDYHYRTQVNGEYEFDERTIDGTEYIRVTLDNFPGTYAQYVQDSYSARELYRFEIYPNAAQSEIAALQAALTALQTDYAAYKQSSQQALARHISDFNAYKTTVDEQIAEALKNYTAATNTENAVETVTRTVAEGTLLADPENGPIGAYFAFISEEVFNPYKDGLQIWLNGTRFIPRDYYVIAYGGGVKVEMNGCTFYTHIMQAGSPERWYIYFDWERIQFSVGDRLEFIINHSPQAVSAITAGRAVSVSSGSMTSYQGTSEEG